MNRWALGAALLLVVSSGFAQDGQKPKPTKVNQLKNHLAEVRDQKSKIQTKLRETKRKANRVVADIRVVDNRLEHVENALEKTKGDLSFNISQQRRLSSELKSTTAQLAEAKQQVRLRLKRMYMRGETSLVSAMVGTRSAGDLASRQELMERVARRDREIFEDFRRLQNQVATQKSQKDQAVRNISRLAQDQKQQQNELEEIRSEKGELLTDLKSQQKRLRQMLAQIEADEAEISSKIAAYMRAANGSPSLPAFRGRLMRPVNARITSGFGSRYHPILRIRRMHAGVDFGARSGTPIMAAGDGIVIAATYLRGYGNTVIIQHGSGVQTVYGHCSKLFVRQGQSIRRGQTIAAVGSTGMSTGPHLHFEVRVNGRPQNPMSWL
ncbi:MAG: murein hydrolase activator EnvC family protein [Fimbriimonas sp.]